MAEAQGAPKWLTITTEATKIWIIVLVGYVSRRTGHVSPEASIGIGQLAGRVALPALIFKLVASADFGSVDWRLVGCIMGCQVAIAVGAGLMAFFAGNKFPGSPRLSVSGAFGLFMVNTDYTAVGVPLISSLFPESQLLYLYILAIGEVIILEPIAFLVMELGQKRGEVSDSKWEFALIIRASLFKVLTDINVLAGILGVVWNASTGGMAVPGIFGETLTGLGSAFRTCCLFNLGMGIVGHLHAINARDLTLPVALVLWKSLAWPVLARSVTTLIVGSAAGEFAFLCGVLGTASSTPLIVGVFMPKLVDVMRLGTVLNLVMKMPLFLVAATVSDSSWYSMQETLSEMRQILNAASVMSIAVLLACFAVASRWRRYPMLLLLDLIVFDMVFQVSHLLCARGAADPYAYMVNNVFRLARYFYILGLAGALVAARRWDKWYPNTPWGYPELWASVGEGASQHASGWHAKARVLHVALRWVSLLFGSVLTIVFAGFQEGQSLGCWIKYGLAQWRVELAVAAVLVVAEVCLMVAFMRARGQHKHSAGMLSRIAAVVWVGIIHAYCSLVLAAYMVFRGSADLDNSFGSSLLLMLDMLIRDGGGVWQLLFFQGVYGAGPAFLLIFLRAEAAVLGATRCSRLRLLAAEIAAAASIEAFHVRGADGDSGQRRLEVPYVSQDSRWQMEAREALRCRRPGFKLGSVKRWLQLRRGCSDSSKADAMVAELEQAGYLKRARLCSRYAQLRGTDEEAMDTEYCFITLKGQVGSPIFEDESTSDGESESGPPQENDSDRDSVESLESREPFG